MTAGNEKEFLREIIVSLQEKITELEEKLEERRDDIEDMTRGFPGLPVEEAVPYTGWAKGRVTVILPLFDGAQSLGESIESVFTQGYEDIEFIIVNCGAVDETRAVLQEYVGRARIKVIAHGGHPVSTFLRSAYAYATGEFYTLMSCGDVMLPGCLEGIVWFLRERPSIGLVCTGFEAVESEGHLARVSTRELVRTVFGSPPEDGAVLGGAGLGSSPGEVPARCPFVGRHNVLKVISDHPLEVRGAEDHEHVLHVSDLFPIGHLDAFLYRCRPAPHAFDIPGMMTMLLEKSRKRRVFYRIPFRIIGAGFEYLQVHEGLDHTKNLLLFRHSLFGDERVERYRMDRGTISVCVIDGEYDEEILRSEAVSTSDLIVTSDIENFEILYPWYRSRLFNFGNFPAHLESLVAIAQSVSFRRQFAEPRESGEVQLLEHERKLNIALQLDNFDRGGLEQVVYDLAVSLDSDRFNVTVLVTGRKGHLGDRLQSRGVAVIEINGSRDVYLSVLKEGRIDVLSVHYSTFGLDMARTLNIAVVSTVHSTYTWLDDEQAAQFAEADKHIHRYVAVSKQVERFYRKKFVILPRKFRIVPNGLNVGDLCADREVRFTRQTLDLREDDFVFLNVGHFSEVKAHHLMLLALRDLLARYPAMRLIFVGYPLDEDYYRRVMNTIEEKGLQHAVRVACNVDREHVGDFYELSDVFLLPSVQEGWSVAAMEAMYFNLPLILSDFGFAKDLLEDNDIGLTIRSPYRSILDVDVSRLTTLCRSCKQYVLADLKMAMADMYENRDAWAERAKRGRDKILGDFSIGKMAREYERHFVEAYYNDRKGDLSSLESDWLQRKGVGLLVGQLRQREQRIKQISEQVSMMSREMAGLRDELAEKQRYLADLEGRVREGEKLNSELSHDLSRTRDALAIVYGSRTWRIGQAFGRCARSLRVDKIIMRAMGTIETLVEHGTTHVRILRTQGLRKYIGHSYDYRKKWLLRRFSIHGGGSTYRDQLRAILSAHKNAKGIIVFPPTADWNSPLYQRPQHMATHLARKGYLFFYCTAKTASDVIDGFQRIEENCYLTDQYDVVVNTARGFIFDLYSTQQSVDLEFLRQLQAESLLVYEYVDHIHQDVSGGKADLVRQRHKGIVPDIVMASAYDLFDEMVRQFGPQKVLYLPNAVDYGHFHVSKDHTQVPDDLRPILEKKRPIIGYYGALAKWLDYDLINALARSRPDYEILLIGWDYEKSVSRLEQKENIHYLETRPYGILPRYAAWFDVAIIPFLPGELADSTSPLKLFEYMALGKPIVTTNMKECKRYRSVMSAADHAEFITTVDRALGMRGDPEYLAILDEEAKANTWEARADEYDRALQNLLEKRRRLGWGISAGGIRGRVSVVLPVYNQANYLEGAIEGALNQTYGDVELIIVNDGSTDGVEMVLDKYVGNPRVKILFQENQKLPKALNNGFAYATGEYFTWTSADNIMFPNQIEDLVRALEENAEVAMVFSDYQAIDDRGFPLNDPAFRPQNQDRHDPSIMKLPSSVTFANLHDSGDNFIGPSFLYRRSVAKIIGDYAHDTFGGEDYDYWLRVNSLFKIQHVDKVLYRYRIHDNTLNARARELNLFENIRRLLERDKARRAFYERPFTVVRVGFPSAERRPGDPEKVILLFVYTSRNHPFVEEYISDPHVVSFCVLDRGVDEFALDDEPLRMSDYLVTGEREVFNVTCSGYPEKTFFITKVEEKDEFLKKMANSRLFNRISGMTYPK